MVRRLAAALLWFLLGVNAWAFVTAFTQVPSVVGILLGVFLAASAFMWPRPTTTRHRLPG